MSDLTKKKCVPCEGGIGKLSNDEACSFLVETPKWKHQGERIAREFVFKDFVEAMVFVNRVAGIAEAEGHHPDILIHFNKVQLVLWTHAIGGLSENDFILAAKIDQLA